MSIYSPLFHESASRITGVDARFQHWCGHRPSGLLLRSIHSMDRVPVIWTDRVLMRLGAADGVDVPPLAVGGIVLERSSRYAACRLAIQIGAPRSIHQEGVF